MLNVLQTTYARGTDDSLPVQVRDPIYAELNNERAGAVKGARIPEQFLQESLRIRNRHRLKHRLALKEEQTQAFHYNRLSEPEQKLYGEILYILQEHLEDIQISTTDSGEVEKVFQCVLMTIRRSFMWKAIRLRRYALWRGTVENDDPVRNLQHDTGDDSKPEETAY